MFTVYILYSTNYNNTYTGQTKDFAKRLSEHNETAKSGYTIKYRPWVVLHKEQFITRTDAMKREKYFKTWEGRIWINEILDRDFK